MDYTVHGILQARKEGKMRLVGKHWTSLDLYLSYIKDMAMIA